MSDCSRYRTDDPEVDCTRSGTQVSARSLREELSETIRRDEVAEEQAFTLIEKKEADVE